MPDIPIPPPHEQFVDKDGKVTDVWYRYLQENTFAVNAGSSGVIIDPTTAQGDILYRSSTGVVALPAGVSGQILETQGASSNPQWVTGWKTLSKSSNQVVTNSSALTDDVHLTFAASSATRYQFEVIAFYNTSTAADFVFAMSGPTAPTVLSLALYGIGPDDVAVGGIVTTAFGVRQSLGASAGNNGYAAVRGLIQNGANAGNIAFQFAQNTAVSTACTVYAGSIMRYTTV